MIFTSRRTFNKPGRGGYPVDKQDNQGSCGYFNIKPTFVQVLWWDEMTAVIRIEP